MELIIKLVHVTGVKSGASKTGQLQYQHQLLIGLLLVLVLINQKLLMNFGSPSFIQSHQEIVMVMAMETLNILYHQDIMHLTQKFSGVWIMAYTNIDKPTDYFTTKLYTGTGTSQTMGLLVLDSNLIFMDKNRSGADSHSLEDSVRGGCGNI